MEDFNSIDAESLISASVEQIIARNYKKALEFINEALVKEPYNVQALCTRASIHDKMSNSQLCLDDLNFALEIDPTHSEIFNIRCQFHYVRGEIDKALSDYDIFISYSDEVWIRQYLIKHIDFYSDRLDEFTNKIEQGIELTKIGKNNEAIHLFEDAILIFPNRIEGFANLGNVYVELEKYDKAIKNFQEAIQIDNRNPDLYFNLGLLYKNLVNIQSEDSMTNSGKWGMGAVGDSNENAQACFLMASYFGDETAIQFLKEMNVHYSELNLPDTLLNIATTKSNWNFLRSAIMIYKFVLTLDKDNESAKNGINYCNEQLNGLL